MSLPEKKRAPETTQQDPAKVRALKSKIKMCLMGSIPPVAHVVAKAQTVMADPFSSLKELAQVIETDPGITTRALKMANSVYYGLSGKVTSIQHAAVLLGNKIIGEIISVAGARGFLGEKLNGYGLDSGVLWRHSLAAAVSSKFIAEKRCPEDAENAFISGLLHDAGMIMLDPHIFERKELFDDIINQGSHNFLEAERSVLGTDHCEVGAEILKEWGIPATLIKPIEKHHHPTSSSGPLGYVVHLGDIMARRFGFGTGQADDMLYEIDGNALDFFGIQEEDLGLFQTEITQSVERIEMEVLQELV